MLRNEVLCIRNPGVVVVWGSIPQRQHDNFPFQHTVDAAPTNSPSSSQSPTVHRLLCSHVCNSLAAHGFAY